MTHTAGQVPALLPRERDRSIGLALIKERRELGLQVIQENSVTPQALGRGGPGRERLV